LNFEDALTMARTAMRILQLNPARAVESQPLIPAEMRARVRRALEREQEVERTIHIRDLRMIEEPARRYREWLRGVDRQSWYYWPRLRQLLLVARQWPQAAVQALDEQTDRILRALDDPCGAQDFDTRGLVVGYVQSGKTANYSALIAKAADVGYRLVIVLTGVHDSLRQQTQRRLNAELVGDGGTDGVTRPADERRWLTFTTTNLKGDFEPGNVTTAGLAGDNPALIVAKKNARVLQRLNTWLRDLPADTRRRLAVLVIDDEADQASPNTRGNRPFPDAEEDLDEPDEALDASPPSRINELIRRLLNGFPRVAYVAYTATPFANVLIDHLADDRLAGWDLYPRSFIVDLPEPHGYYGAEKIFGSPEDAASTGMNVIRRVPDGDRLVLVPRSRDEVEGFEPLLPRSLIAAIDDFVLAGAARYQRGAGDQPATMLIHASHYRAAQQRLYDLVVQHLAHLRDDWRYNRAAGLEQRLRDRWDFDFRRVTRAENLALDVGFDAIIPDINSLLEHPVQVLQINSTSQDVLDYQRDPSLKAIVVGGNRLSRGLTLEGLLVSYYVRRANTYDTLMQMGRWFGFRDGYGDLTRIYTTSELEQWFRDLVTVEAELREDIRRYAEEDLTPLDFGVRIRRHPALLVTDRLKMRSAQVEAMSFAGQLVQTIIFPFEDRDWLRANVEASREFLSSLGSPDGGSKPRQPMWRAVPWQKVEEFLCAYQMDPSATRVRQDLLLDFLRRQADRGELIEWVVGVMGQERREERLRTIDLHVAGVSEINLIERTRLEHSNSLGVITSPAHLALGLPEERLREATALEGRTPSGRTLRKLRDPREGLLLIYPISRYAGWRNGEWAVVDGREPIFATPETGEDIIGVALALPPSKSPATVEYVVGTVGVGTT
jgi:hypothetical protein